MAYLKMMVIVEIAKQDVKHNGGFFFYEKDKKRVL